MTWIESDVVDEVTAVARDFGWNVQTSGSGLPMTITAPDGGDEYRVYKGTMSGNIVCDNGDYSEQYGTADDAAKRVRMWLENWE